MLQRFSGFPAWAAHQSHLVAGGRGSRGGRRRDFKNLNVQAAPGPISLAFLGVGLSVNCFLKLARWFQCAAEMALNYLHWWLLLRLWDPGGGAPNRSGWCNGNPVLAPPRIKGQGCSLVPSVEVDPLKTHWSGHGGLEGHRCGGGGVG